MGLDCDTTRHEEKLPFLCECGKLDCELCVPLTASEYVDLAQRPPWLALAPGHGPGRRSTSRRDDR
jgi:hypothetical protein